MPIARSGATDTSRRSGFYTTAFPLTENPISEGGMWTNGGTTGLDWKNIQTNGTSAFGVGVSAGYDDCIACLSGFIGSTTSHYAQGTLHKAGGYSPGTSHESELWVGMTVSAHVAQGYEATWDVGAGLQLVRWNGALGNFTVSGASDDNLATGKGWTDTYTGTAGSQLVDGDVVKITYSVDGSGNVTLVVYANGVQFGTVQDTSVNKISSGRPGIGSFGRTGATMSSYCWSSFTAA